jgi:hypothetical protein
VHRIQVHLRIWKITFSCFIAGNLIVKVRSKISQLVWQLFQARAQRMAKPAATAIATMAEARANARIVPAENE